MDRLTLKEHITRYRIILPMCLVLSGIFTTCRKSDTPINTRNIVVEQLDMTIVYPSKDTISSVCGRLIFTVKTDSAGLKTAILSGGSGILECQEFNSFLTSVQNGHAVVLDNNVQVPPSGNWQAVYPAISLNDFAGKGEKFIGYSAYSYPQGSISYRYGWIKIKLSANRDTLKLLSRATNQTYGQVILTGQTQ